MVLVWLSFQKNRNFGNTINNNGEAASIFTTWKTICCVLSSLSNVNSNFMKYYQCLHFKDEKNSHNQGIYESTNINLKR